MRRDAARRLNVRFVGLFLVIDLTTRQTRVSYGAADACDATLKIARLQEKYNTVPVD
jgi:predicted kinase